MSGHLQVHAADQEEGGQNGIFAPVELPCRKPEEQQGQEHEDDGCQARCFERYQRRGEEAPEHSGGHEIDRRLFKEGFAGKARDHPVAGLDHGVHEAEGVRFVRFPGIAAEEAGRDPENEQKNKYRQGTDVEFHRSPAKATWMRDVRDPASRWLGMCFYRTVDDCCQAGST